VTKRKKSVNKLVSLKKGLMMLMALTAKANGTTAEQGGNFLAATSGRRRLKGRWRIIM
jgi:hypothetical protein